MLRNILTFGVIAGLIVCANFVLVLVAIPGLRHQHSVFYGYLVMLVALSMVFLAVKRYRDRNLGGVIKFLPALGVGLGVSVVAGVIYTLGWEVCLVATHYAFADDYGAAMLNAARAKGASPAHLAEIAAQMQAFKAQYANPFYRLPMTFVEIFPVGVLISLISAALLRNSRFLPARAAA